MVNRWAARAVAAQQAQDNVGPVGEQPREASWGGARSNPIGDHVHPMTFPRARRLILDEEAKPDEFVRFLKQNGIHRITDLRTTDPAVLAKFRNKPFLTVGSDGADVDCCALWQHVLGLATLEAPHSDDCPPIDEEAADGTDEEHGVLLPSRQPLRKPLRKAATPRRLWGLVRSAVNTGLLRPAKDAWAHDVQLEAFVVAVQDAAAPGEAGLLQPLLRRYQAQMCSVAVFGLPAVQAVVSYKWRAFAKRLLMWELVVYCIWLFSFFGFMGCFDAQSSAVTLRQLVSTTRGRFCVAFEVSALVGMVPFVAQDLMGAYLYRTDWLSAWNVLDASTYVLQVAITCLHLGHLAVGANPASAIPLSHALPLLIGIQCIFLFLRLQFFSRCFRGTAFDFLDSLQAVLMETWWYICVMLLLVLGFAGAFWITFRDTEQQQFNSLPLAALTMLNWAVGGASFYFNDVINSDHPDVALSLCVIYQFVVSMIMMSLLIGILTAALTKSSATEHLKFHLSRARIIDELESIMPTCLLRRLNMPRYVHVLRISPSSISNIESQYMWLSSGHQRPMPVESVTSGASSRHSMQSAVAEPQAATSASGSSQPPAAAAVVPNLYTSFSEYGPPPGGTTGDRGTTDDRVPPGSLYHRPPAARAVPAVATVQEDGAAVANFTGADVAASASAAVSVLEQRLERVSGDVYDVAVEVKGLVREVAVVKQLLMQILEAQRAAGGGRQ